MTNNTVISPVYPMLIQKYNTLIPDPNANVLDKINTIIDYLNQTGKLTNDVVNQWNQVMAWAMNDGLNTDVSNKLETMLSSGEFDALFQKYIAPSLGDIKTLQTNDKTSAVNAINEVDQLAKTNQTNLGTLSNLTTTDKSSLVNAVNEAGNLSKTNQTNIGTLSNLQTTDKGNLVAAINDNVAQLAEIASVNAMQKGCKGDGVTDDTAALQAAINATPSGGNLLIPFGTYLHSGISFTSTINVICFGKLQYTGSGIGVQVNCNNSMFEGFNLYRSYSNSGPASALVGTALDVIGKNNRFINPVIEGFNVGIMMDGGNGVSSGYHTIISPRITNCFIGYQASSVGTGWANEVTVISGRFGIGGFSDNTGTRYINLVAGNEGHRFFGTTLEGGTGMPERKIKCDGQWNEFNGIRWEGSNGGTDIEFTSNAANNFILAGRYLEQCTIVDNGSAKTTILSAFQFQHVGKKIIGFKKLTSGSYNTGNEDLYLLDASSGAVTLTLLNNQPGSIVEVKRIDTSNNAVSYVGQSGTIDGISGWLSLQPNQSVKIITDGTNWFRIAERNDNNITTYTAGSFTYGNGNGTIFLDATSGACTVQLNAMPKGTVVTLKRKDSSANAVNWNGYNCQVDGGTGWITLSALGTAKVISDGSNWWKID